MTAGWIDSLLAKVRRLGRVQILAPSVLLIVVLATGASANQPPVADAGPSRYAGDEPIILDGTGSYDPDPGDTITYQWMQVSGPSVVLAETDTATPNMKATLTGSVEIIELELTVTDSQQATSTDTVQVTLVSSIPRSGKGHKLASEPFDPNKPTFVIFSGGDCKMGTAGAWGSDEWKAKVNVILGSDYVPDVIGTNTYYSYGNSLIVFLSSLAPEYDQPIETAGSSTGGMPAIDSAIQMNSYQDVRYNVNRVSFLDAACRDYEPYIEAFTNNPVAFEPTWIVNYTATYNWGFSLNYRAGTLNIYIEGVHETPLAWLEASIAEDFYSTPTIYNHGLVAGAFLSVVGEGKNYHIPPEAAGFYLFNWGPYVYEEGPREVTYFDRINFPGALPEPVTLIGPPAGTLADVTGVTLECETSEHAVAYQLLWGIDKQNLQVVCEQNGPLSVSTGPLPPGQTFYWTVKVRDQYGTTIYADPRELSSPEGLAGDFNGDGQLDNTDCAIVKSSVSAVWGEATFALAADLDGDGSVTCLDTEAWLVLYRNYLQDPGAPDPCGLQDTTDTDSDGTRDLCDNCPSIKNTDQKDEDADGDGDACDLCTDTDGDGWGDPGFPANECLDDNCPSQVNPDQLDTDSDGAGDACDPDIDNDGFGNDNDNCPTVPSQDQQDADGDGRGDACDLCTDIDGDGLGDPGFPVNKCLEDNCPSEPNRKQLDTDEDGLGDACDDDMDNDGYLNDVDNCPLHVNPDQADSDGDTAGDVCDNCPDIANVNDGDVDCDGDGWIMEFYGEKDGQQCDVDRDGLGDLCDDDIDGDGYANDFDNCPTRYNPDQSDDDGDGVGDVCDTDFDNDGVPNGSDNCPTISNPDQRDTDQDHIGNACDPCTDTDGDGFGNPGFPLNECLDDNCPKQANPNQEDVDNDTVGDLCDNCPNLTNTDQADIDSDKVGDECDNCPNIWNQNQSDFDNDAVGDLCDDDIDGDGYSNDLDNCPMEINPNQEDGDTDGVGDVCDTCRGTMFGLIVDQSGCPLPIPGDFDDDGDVDLDDFGHFQACITGPDGFQFASECKKARLDNDFDVDQNDLAIFQLCISGANVAANANCDD